MAKLSQKILGKVSGTLGDITFRQRNGKNFLASRPSRFNAPQDQVSLKRRSRFAFAVRISSIINSIPRLISIWLPKTPAGVKLYNFLVSTIYKYVDADTVKEGIMLTPSFGFGISIVSAALSENNLSVVLEPLGNNSGLDIQKEKNICMISLLCFSSPVNPDIEKYVLLNLAAPVQSLQLDTQLTFTAVLNTREAELYEKYNVKKSVFVFVTLDAENNAVNYSSTCLI